MSARREHVLTHCNEVTLSVCLEMELPARLHEPDIAKPVSLAIEATNEEWKAFRHESAARQYGPGRDQYYADIQAIRTRVRLCETR